MARHQGGWLTLRITSRQAVRYICRRDLSLRLGPATEIKLDDARYFAEQTRLAVGRKRDLREFVGTLVTLETEKKWYRDRLGNLELADQFADESSRTAMPDLVRSAPASRSSLQPTEIDPA